MSAIREQDLVPVENLADEGLRRRLAEENISLKDDELGKIRRLLGRNPTVVELHIFNVMWSEHCSYKSSRPLLKTLPTDGPHVVLGPGEDAGIIRFFEKDGEWHCLVLAHESHNHPSQVLPAEGAATGIGGIVRDVYCMGADVIGVLDPLRFGDPDGPNAKRVREIVRGVVDGISQYGNALGVPNYGGDTYFDAAYDDNCLVNVVAVGVVRERDIVRSRAPQRAAEVPHDIVLVGKPTDASGFGGAAFASERLSGDQEEERQEAVQVPDPFLKRVLVEATRAVLAEARRLGVGIGFKDLGAGGISCAVSEMAHAGAAGAVVDLSRVRTAGPLPAAVIACSETQERFAWIVPAEFTACLCRIFNEDFELPHIYTGAGAVVIGRTTGDMRFRLEHDGIVVCDAGMDAITAGIEYTRPATPRAGGAGCAEPPDTDGAPPAEDALMTLLSSPNIADKSILFRHYDSEVQGRAVLRPGEADAAVAVFMPGESVGVAVAVGGNSGVGRVDPYLGGVWAVLEAARNVACVGGRPLAVTDCLNFGDPEDPEVFWEFSEAVRGIGEACRGLAVFADPAQGVPVVSGNVSFYNQSGQGEPIAPTPVVACAGRVDEIARSQGFGFKRPGSALILLGVLHDRLGGSEYARCFAVSGRGDPPAADFGVETAIVRALAGGFEAGHILAAHDISHGGLLVTLSEMVVQGACGCVVDVSAALPPGAPAAAYLFSEYGGVVVEVDREERAAFDRLVARCGAPAVEIGETAAGRHLAATWPEGGLDVSRDSIYDAWCTGGRCNALFA